MQSTKEKVISIIHELVPETMALTFGCEVKNIHSNRVLKVVENCNKMADEGCDITLFSNDSLYLYEASSKDGSLEILGHPITLADVLRAVHDKNSYPKISIHCDGNFTMSGIRTCYNWDLTKDLSGQSDEVFEFLLTILEK